MSSRFSGRTKKHFQRLIIAAIFISVIGVTTGIFTDRAQAQIGVSPSMVIILENLALKRDNAITKALKTAADLAYKNALRNFLNRVAYDTAIYIASGGTGQKPLFYTKPLQVIQDIGDAAGGDFLNTLSTSYFGKNLCEPIDLQTKVQLGIFAQKLREPTQLGGKCTVTKIGNNLDKSYQKNTNQVLIDFSYNFNPEQNEFGGFLQIKNDLIKNQEEAKQKQRDSALFTGITGFKSVVSPITGEVKTPASFIEYAATLPLQQSFEAVTKQTGTPLADAFGVFSNTLVSKLLQRIFSSSQGFNPGTNAGFFSQLFNTQGGGIATAKSIFSTLAQPDYLTGGTVDVVSDLASCPSNPGYSNCIIDNRFAQAIQQKLTLREAMDAGLLDGNKAFGYNADGQEPEYINGYPYRSLVILRTYRIIPVGWELAAEYIKNFSKSSFSLKEVADKFNNCGQKVCSNDKTKTCSSDLVCPDTNGDGAPDGTCSETISYSPFCGLVDPNWTLKAPEVFCKREGATEQTLTQNWVDQNGDEQLATQGTVDKADVTPREEQVTRQTGCVDQQTCIIENPDGSCQRYGYCTEERDVWQFKGQACDAQYASCKTFTNPKGQSVSYLQNTTEKNGCNANNAGCQWYCQEQDSKGNWACDFGLSSTGQQNRIAFDRDAPACDVAAAGCSEFIRTKPGLGTNLARNSSFEFFDKSIITDSKIDDGVDDRGPALDGYDIGNSAQSLDVTKNAYSGSYAMKLIGGPGPSWYAPAPFDSLQPVGGRTFTFSYYAKLSQCADGRTSADGGNHIENFNPYEDWAVDKNGLTSSTVTYKQDAWQRYSRTATFTRGLKGTGVNGVINAIDGCTIVIDDVQLEEGGATSAYGDYATVNKTYLNGARKSCSMDDVGCNLYTPLDGSIPVTGKITDSASCDPNDPGSCDQCPAAFVGCKAYREMPIDHTPIRPAKEPVSFVSTTGKSCPATQVGCEEYTNLDQVARGGEGLEYYSFIRQCVKPADAGSNAQSYYSWVGNEESGYQLKEFRLLRSETAEAGGNYAPCTNLGPDTPSSTNRYPNCVDGVPFDENGDGIVENHLAAVCTVNDLQKNPDCTEFYDASGLVTYRLRSKLIFVSDDCHPFKNSIDTAAGNNVTYHMVPGEGLTCSAAFAGCREYKGSAGNNVRTIISSDFEGGTIAPWSSNADPALNPSTNAAQAGGHSMVVFPLPTGASTVIDTLIQRDHSYILTFWAAGGANDTSIESALYDGTGVMIPNSKFSGTAIARQGNWNQYSLGPLFVNQDIPAGSILFIGGNNSFFLDNIQLQEVTDDIFRVQGTTTQCSGYENCSAYRDREGQVSYLKSFSKICKSDAVGCEAMIQTNNGDYPFDQSVQVTKRPRGDYNNDLVVDQTDLKLIESYYDGRCTTGPLANTATSCNPDDPTAVCGTGQTCHPGINRPDPWAIMDMNGDGTVDGNDVTLLHDDVVSHTFTPVPFPQSISIPGDTLVAVVNDPAVQCQAAQAGCTKMGKPTINADNVVSGYQTTYLINDPDQYATSLCHQEESGCQEFKTDTGLSYFKDPGGRTCQYVAPSGTKTAGWFVTGTTIGCGPQNTVSSVGPGMVGTCPAEQNGCTEYRDPLDPKGCDVNIPAGQSNAGRCSATSGSPGAFCDTTAFCNGGAHNAQECDILNPEGICGVGHPCVLSNANPQCAGGSCVPVASCAAHYNLAQSTDTKSCNGVVNQQEGCRLFYDTNSPPATFYAKGTNDGSVPSGACDNNPLTPAAPDCDSNQLVKVQRDRVCNTWLECKTGTTVKAASGSQEQVCFERQPCNKLDPITGACVGLKACSDTGATCVKDSDCINGICTLIASLTPVNVCSNDLKKRCPNGPSDCSGQPCIPSSSADLVFTSSSDQTNNISKMQNISGLAKAGVNWGFLNVCTNDLSKQCSNDGECGGGKCGIDRLIGGDYPYAVMHELGTFGSTTKDLIKDGDFWDSNYMMSQEIKPNDSTTQWKGGETYRGWTAIGADTKVALTERSDDGSIPGNPLLNENNVLAVHPGSGMWDGVSYNLGNKIQNKAEYSISMKQEYEQGNATQRDVIQVEFEYLDVTGNRIGIDSFGWLTGSTSWQEYVVGNVTTNIPVGTVKTLLKIIQGPSHCTADPTNINLCSTDSSPVNNGPSVILCLARPPVGSTCAGSERTFYLDDVSLKPVLGVQSGSNTGPFSTPDKLTRTCRMYPRDDSKLCEYTDFDGVQYRGWKGYCIEKDPKNPDICINWWPIDIISGESSIFGQEQQAGYQERTPLYFCELARGNSQIPLPSSTLPATPGYVLNTRINAVAPCYDGDPCVYAKLTNDCSGTSYTIMNVAPTDVPFQGANLILSGDDYASNCMTDSTNASKFICDTPGSTAITDPRIIPANAAEKAINRTDIEAIKVTLNSKVREWNNESFYIKPDSFYQNNPKIWHGGTTEEGFDFNYTPQCSAEHAPMGFGMRVRFDDNGFVLGYDVRAGLPKSGPSAITIVINYQLREPCDQIVKVAGDEVVSWANRVSNGSGYQTQLNNNYGYNADLAPFGAIPPLVGTPADWFGKEHNTPLYVQVPYADKTKRSSQTRAGLPYACDGKTPVGPVFTQSICGQAICMGGDFNGSDCKTLEAQRNCENKGGYCSGILPPVTVTESLNPVHDAEYTLRRLFAIAYEGWVWDNTKGQYVRDDFTTDVTSWQTQFDNMSICPNNQRPAPPSDYCAVQPAVTNFILTVNGKDYSNASAPAGGWTIPGVTIGSTIKMSFTENVDKEQMPLDTILIDWDGKDGSVPSDNQGSMAWGFAPRSDPKNPNTFFYTVTKTGDYTPRVEIIDHWGAGSNVCISVGGSCTFVGQRPGTRQASSSGKPDDSVGWYGFNGVIKVTD